MENTLKVFEKFKESAEDDVEIISIIIGNNSEMMQQLAKHRDEYLILKKSIDDMKVIVLKITMLKKPVQESKKNVRQLTKNTTPTAEPIDVHDLKDTTVEILIYQRKVSRKKKKFLTGQEGIT